MNDAKPARPDYRLALAYTSAAVRPAVACLLAFDERLEALVVHSSEPMLARIKLAWWRDQLSAAALAQARDPLLIAIARDVPTTELAAFHDLIDAWEVIADDDQADRLAAIDSGITRLAGKPHPAPVRVLAALRSGGGPLRRLFRAIRAGLSRH